MKFIVAIYYSRATIHVSHARSSSQTLLINKKQIHRDKELIVNNHGLVDFLTWIVNKAPRYFWINGVIPFI